jgi:folate-binding protein YgfZ
MNTLSASLSGAVVVEPSHIDAGLVWHFGDPFAEQRAWVAGKGNVELANRFVLTVTGDERLSYLNALTTQLLLGIQPGQSAITLNLSPQGFVLHEIHVIDDGKTAWLVCESETAKDLADYLVKMRFRTAVDIADVSAHFVVVAQPEVTNHAEFLTFASPFTGLGREVIVPREKALDVIAASPTGVWAYNAIRVAAGAPRQGVETDHHTIPLELNWLAAAVHMDKGCYRGQETVSKVARIGKPPRRHTLLHLDGSVDSLPGHATDVTLDGTTVGFIGQAVQHYELGPIASAVIKRSVSLDAVLDVAGIRASQELIA